MSSKMTAVLVAFALIAAALFYALVMREEGGARGSTAQEDEGGLFAGLPAGDDKAASDEDEAQSTETRAEPERTYPVVKVDPSLIWEYDAQSKSATLFVEASDVFSGVACKSGQITIASNHLEMRSNVAVVLKAGGETLSNVKYTVFPGEISSTDFFARITPLWVQSAKKYGFTVESPEGPIDQFSPDPALSKALDDCSR